MLAKMLVLAAGLFLMNRLIQTKLWPEHEGFFSRSVDRLNTLVKIVRYIPLKSVFSKSPGLIKQLVTLELAAGSVMWLWSETWLDRCTLKTQASMCVTWIKTCTSSPVPSDSSTWNIRREEKGTNSPVCSVLMPRHQTVSCLNHCLSLF